MTSENERTGSGDRLRTALFMGMFLFLWITTQPYSGGVRLEGAEAAAGSNALNQLVALILSGGMIVAALNSPLRTLVLRPRVLLGLMFAWFLVSAALSPAPVDAVKRVVLAVLTCTSAAAFLMLPTSRRHFAQLVGAGTLIMLGFAYFGVVALPMHAIHQAADTVEPGNAGFWRGHYTHKNVAAAVMLVAVFTGLYLRSTGFRRTGIAIAILGGFFLLHTGGKSSTAMLPLVLVLAHAFERWPVTRMPIAIGGIAVFNLFVLGSAFSPGIHSLIGSFGIDATFTNRTDVWQFAMKAIARHPILGYGFQGFWQSDTLMRNASRLESWATAAFNGHNAYLDLVVTTGVPGLVLTLLWLWVLPLRDAGRAYASDNDPALTRFFVRIWLYGMYTGCLESIFFQSGSPLWFLMMVSVFGLRLQGEASLIREPSPSPSISTVAHA